MIDATVSRFLFCILLYIYSERNVDMHGKVLRQVYDGRALSVVDTFQYGKDDECRP